MKRLRRDEQAPADEARPRPAIWALLLVAASLAFFAVTVVLLVTT